MVETSFLVCKLCLLLCIQTLRTLRLTPISWQNCCTTLSSCFCNLHPLLSAKLSILSFWSWVNFVLNLFFIGLENPPPTPSISSDWSDVCIAPNGMIMWCGDGIGMRLLCPEFLYMNGSVFDPEIRTPFLPSIFLPLNPPPCWCWCWCWCRFWYNNSKDDDSPSTSLLWKFRWQLQAEHFKASIVPSSPLGMNSPHPSVALPPMLAAWFFRHSLYFTKQTPFLLISFPPPSPPPPPLLGGAFL